MTVVPNEFDLAVNFLEEELSQDIDKLNGHVPDETAPLGEQIEFARYSRRVESDHEFIKELKQMGKLALTVALDKHTK